MTARKKWRTATIFVSIADMWQRLLNFSTHERARRPHMPAQPIYAAQKTREAVTALAVSPKPLRERVSYACFVLHILTADEIPDKALQDRLMAIMADRDKMKPGDHTLSHLNDQEISHIASEIVSIYEGCIRLYTGSMPPLT
jgi:hypothetical protein